MKPSKNSVRKQKRAPFHNLMNELTRDPENSEALRQLGALFEQHFSQVDQDLSRLDSKPAEKKFIKRILLDINNSGWVEVHCTDGRVIQLKADLWDYIRSRHGKDLPSAMAAEHLLQSAVRQIQIRPAPSASQQKRKR